MRGVRGAARNETETHTEGLKMTTATKNTETRDACAASWKKAQEQANASGAVRCTAAVMAGHYLEVTKGDVQAALALVPKSAESPFWARVISNLGQIVVEEGAGSGEATRDVCADIELGDMMIVCDTCHKLRPAGREHGYKKPAASQGTK